MISQAKRIIHLAWPIIITQLALSGMVTVDTIMAGRYSATDLAAIGTSLGLWQPISLFALGVLTGIGAIFSRNYGGEEKKQAKVNISNGILLALILSLVTYIALSYRQPIMQLLSFDPAMASIMDDYIFYLMLGLPGFCLFCLFRVLNESFGNTRLIMYLQIGALLLNIPLNLIFIFGAGPIPELGGAGAGISTTLLHYLLFIVLAILSLTKANTREYIQGFGIKYLDKKILLDFVKLGGPVGLTFFFEVALFGSVALAIGSYGPQMAAAHQIAINFAGNMYMVILSLSIATSVVIGQSMGAKQPKQALNAAKSGIIISMSVAVFTAIITIFTREYVSLIYTNNEIVAQLAISLLIWAAFFQFADAIQCVILASLRAFKDTHTPMILTLIAYWAIGFPIGWLLAETHYLTEQPLGLHGYWAGLLISLTSAAILLTARFIKIKNQIKF